MFFVKNKLTRWVELAVVVAVAVGIFASGEALAQGQPVAPVRPVTTDYYGTKVVDNYRYMENLGDAEVQAWMKSQAQHTRSVLDALPDVQLCWNAFTRF